MPLKYYFDLMSQPSRAVYMFLKMTSIPFQAKEIALRKLEHMTDDYAKINPFQKVPAIDDDGFCLTESFAIMKYLSDKHGKNDFYSTDLKERARIHEYTHWQHVNLRLSGSMVFQSRVVIPRAKNKPVDQKALDKWLAKWGQTNDQLEKIWLTRSPYLAGSRLTIADLSGICEMMQPIVAGYDLDRSEYPRVYDWMERVKAACQPHFDEAHRFPLMARAKFIEENKKKT